MSTTKEQHLKEHFNEVAGGAAYGSYEERRWKTNVKVAGQHESTEKFVRKFAVPLASDAKHITELGPGPGTWTKLLIEAAPRAELTLEDISGEMLQRAKDALPAGTNVTLQEADFISASLPEDSCDLFFSSRAIEYVSPKEMAIQKIQEHLVRGGQACIITKMPKPLLNQISGRLPSEIHRNQISPSHLAQICRESGLTNVRLYPVTFSFPLLRSASADRFLDSLFGRKRLNPISAFFAESYGIIFSKP